MFGSLTWTAARAASLIAFSGLDLTTLTGGPPGQISPTFEDLPDSGEITGLIYGEYATVLTERAIFRATYTGPPLIWQFDKVVSERGCNFKNSVCNAGNLVFS